MVHGGYLSEVRGLIFNPKIKCSWKQDVYNPFTLYGRIFRL